MLCVFMSYSHAIPTLLSISWSLTSVYIYVQHVPGTRGERHRGQTDKRKSDERRKDLKNYNDHLRTRIIRSARSKHRHSTRAATSFSISTPAGTSARDYGPRDLKSRDVRLLDT